MTEAMQGLLNRMAAQAEAYTEAKRCTTGTDSEFAAIFKPIEIAAFKEMELLLREIRKLRIKEKQHS